MAFFININGVLTVFFKSKDLYIEAFIPSVYWTYEILYNKKKAIYSTICPVVSVVFIYTIFYYKKYWVAIKCLETSVLGQTSHALHQ